MSTPASPVLDHMRAQAKQLYLSGKLAEAADAYRGIMEVVPSDWDAIHHLGQVALQLGYLEEARKLLQAALNLKPDNAEIWLHHGMMLQHLNRADEAVESYREALNLKPSYAEAEFCMGMVQKAAGRPKEALAAFDRFITLRGDVSTAFLHRGDLLRSKGEFDKSLADYETALTLTPNFFDAWVHRGALLAEHGRAQDALASYDKAAPLAPDNGNLWYNRGVALQDLSRDAEALEAYDRAIKLAPDFADSWNNRGTLLRNAGRLEEALESFQRALALGPNHVQSLNNQGSALAALDRNDEALAAYDMAVELNPDSPHSWNNRGNLLRDERRLDEAMGSFQKALAIDPRHADTLANIGGGLQDLKRFAEAMREFRKLELVAPDHIYLLGGLALSALMLCDWQTIEEIWPRLEPRAANGKAILPPFTLMGLTEDEGLLRRAAEHYLRDSVNLARTLPRPAAYNHDRIRLAYVSNDFHAHATARLMSDLFERHDRAKFEVIAISYGPDEKSPARERLKKAFDQFHDVRGKKDAEIAALIQRLEIDIAVDLKLYTEGARPAVFGLRPAPVLVNYLGYPGTSASPVMDYVIADKVTLPFDRQGFYSEQIVQLPDCYQANDPAREIGAVPPRAEAGLPESGFVFCCFNNHWKITRPIFECWMRLLNEVPGSVLWLLEDSASAALKREAEKRGIDPARLIFAPKLAHDAHLGRLSLADLVLDTLPYNAHTTASDALWCGVPMVTLRGKAFAGRVGASLLSAIGLPELIGDDLEGYEKLAKALASDAKKHQALKAKLAKNRLTTPLFDAERFCRHMEAAFVTMADAARRGEAPKAFAVPE